MFCGANHIPRSQKCPFQGIDEERGGVYFCSPKSKGKKSL